MVLIFNLGIMWLRVSSFPSKEFSLNHSLKGTPNPHFEASFQLFYVVLFFTQNDTFLCLYEHQRETQLTYNQEKELWPPVYMPYSSDLLLLTYHLVAIVSD